MPSLASLLRNKYFDSLFGVGYSTDKEKALTTGLFVSSLLLATASGYTTYVGLHQYVPALFALFIATGINSLLFAASWRIGVMLVADRFKLPLPVIFLTTLTISVFFSYSALLDNIYDKASREADELQRSKIRAERLTQQLTQLVRQSSNYEDRANQVRADMDHWYSATVTAYGGRANALRGELSRNKERYTALSLRLEDLRVRPATRRREAMIRRTEAAQQSALNRISPLAPQVDRLDPAKQTFDKAYKALVESNGTLTIDRFGELSTAYKSFVSELAGSSNRSIEIVEIPLAVQHEIGDLDQISKFFQWQEGELAIAKKQSVEEVKQTLYEFVNRLPKSIKTNPQNANQINSVLDQVSLIGKYGGANVHPFVLAVGELSNGNYLATGSLLIAIAIDGLVLFCGLLGARPASFLTMRRPEDLDNALELGLAAIMSINLEAREKTNNPFIDRIIKILRVCEPDVQATQEVSIPMTIRVQTIRDEGLAREIGVFLASGLAKSHTKQDKIGLTLRLILWMADQVYKYDSGEPTATGFSEVPRGGN